MMISQAIILAAGNGKRLGKLGEHYPKIALPVGNTPLYQFHIKMLLSLGVTDLIFVISPSAALLQQEILDHCKTLVAPISVRFIEQSSPKGIAHALMQCSPYVQEHFVVLMGDTYFHLRPPQWMEHVSNKLSSDYSAVLSVREEKNETVIKRECTVAVDIHGDVKELIEKPEHILSTTKPCGMYFFSQKIFQYIERTPPSPLRKEVELTDAIALAAERSGSVSTVFSVEHDINITYIQNYHEANMYHLHAAGVPSIIGQRVSQGTRVELINSIIGNDVVIGNEVLLQRCIVLPGSHISAHSSLHDTVVLYNESVL